MFVLEWTDSKKTGVYFMPNKHISNTQQIDKAFKIPDFATAEKVVAILKEVYSADYHIVKID